MKVYLIERSYFDECSIEPKACDSRDIAESVARILTDNNKPYRFVVVETEMVESGRSAVQLVRDKYRDLCADPFSDDLDATRVVKSLLDAMEAQR